MKPSSARPPILVISGALFALLAAVCGLLFFQTPSGPDTPAAVVKSTIRREPAPSQTSLPFADETGPANPRPGAYNNETAFSSGIPVTSPQPVGPIEIDATQPGNQMHFNGKLISVAEALPSDEGSGHELAVDIVPAPDSSAGPSNEASEEAARREEELFRAKWGWEMADKMKSAALTEDEIPPR
jgi:hypothetical protein